MRKSLRSMNQSVGEFLKKELDQRTRKRKSYSLGAFARDLEVSTSWLSRVLGGTRGISGLRASQLSKRLQLSPAQENYFVTLAQSQFARSSQKKETAQKQLIAHDHVHQDVLEDQLIVLANWHHFAILSLLETKDERQDPKWIALRLHLSENEVMAAIERLLKVKMLTKINGRLRTGGHFFANSQEKPSEAVQSFHRTLLETASTKMASTPLAERYFQSTILGVNPGRMEEAKLFMKEFRDEFERRFCLEEKQRTEVMTLAVQFYPLSEKVKERA
jgi:uncharacterized protein (TIGR02147 family)